MKYLLYITSIICISGSLKAQTFLSPYKDGTPVHDSIKDFSEPVRIHLSSSSKNTSNNTPPKKQQENYNINKKDDEDNSIPIILNINKNNTRKED